MPQPHTRGGVNLTEQPSIEYFHQMQKFKAIYLMTEDHQTCPENLKQLNCTMTCQKICCRGLWKS